METKKLAAICVVLAGCSSYPPPNEGLATSVGAVRAAQEAGAEQVPDAALHLRLAEEENKKATKLMSDDSNERATFMTERARSDADLALALMHEEKARQRARDAVATLNTQNAMEEAIPSTPQGQPNMPETQPNMPSAPENQLDTPGMKP
jgi:hypothetical protein